MRLQRPFECVTPTLDGPILQVLAGAEAGFTGRLVASFIPEASPSGVQRALTRLVGQGIVDLEVVGNAHRYSLNRDHLLAPAVLAISVASTELGDRVRNLVATWTRPPVAVVLYGSGARGDMTVDSDLDLLVVGDISAEIWDEQMLDLTVSVRRWTGNDVRLVEMDADEVEAGAGHVALLDEIARDGWVLAGSPSYLRDLGRRAGVNR